MGPLENEATKNNMNFEIMSTQLEYKFQSFTFTLC